MAQDNVVVQWNFKAPSGAMYNVYGRDEQSFDYGLAILQDRVAQLAAIEQQLQGVGNVAQVIPLAAEQPAAAPAAPQWSQPAAAPAAAAPSFQQAAVPQCAHGARTPRSGTSGKGPWKAWFCSAPKGAGQCDAQWVQKNTPEWNAFPA